MKTTAIRFATLVTFGLSAFALPACYERDEPLTTGEALQALDEASASAQASNLMGSSIEISTSFTIGDGVKAAAQELKSYVHSQLPCAEITLANNSLDIEYGALPGNCTYKGHSYSGGHTITVSKNGAGGVVVEHVWDELSNGVLSVSGQATVNWNFADETRHVVHELTWTRLKDGRTGVGSGDRLQQTLDGGLLEGIQVDGERSWEGEHGSWSLDIDAVQMRWADPVPQSGTYTLVTPNDKQATLSFERLDEDTIQVTLSGGNKTLTFDVNSLGAVQQNDQDVEQDAS